jgi:heat shock protein HslJ
MVCALSAATVSLGLASPATAAPAVHFSGKYSGNASLLIDNGAVTIKSVKGKGTGTLVGASSILGHGSASASGQCNPFTGTGSIAGSGARISLAVVKSSSSGCSSGESGPVTVTFQGVAMATGGSGRASGAKGSLKFTGSLKLAGTSGAQNGSYKVTLTGNLTVRA